jgi:Holliday junction DNA helicase RuvA
MIHHLKGRLIEKHPTHAIVECGGVGYWVNISLTTFERLGGGEDLQILTHLVVREDAQILYGFADAEERELFLALLGVSGVGASTARMILSAMDASTARSAIQSGDVQAMKAVKGIGAKTAQRIIVDLQDRLGSEASVSGINGKNGGGSNNNARLDALTALTTLGFERARCERTLDAIITESSAALAVENLIKLALKRL